MFERDEYQISFLEIIPPIDNLTEDEIKFVRLLTDELKIDLELNVDITIQTDPIDFSYFLVHIIRQYHNQINQ